jgi:hypothetical protein
MEGQDMDAQEIRRLKPRLTEFLLRAKVKVRTLQEFLSQHRWDEDRME